MMPEKMLLLIVEYSIKYRSRKTYRIGAIALDSGNKRLRELGLTDNATISMNNTNGDVTWKLLHQT